MADTLDSAISLTAEKSNFYYSLYLLPKEKREAMKAVYSFFRAADDAVDEPGDPFLKRSRLLQLMRQFDAALRGESSSPILNKLVHVIERFHVPLQPFRDLLVGMEMDLTKTRYETFEELQEYCYHVASTVGLVSIAIFGYKTEHAKDYAINLGTALQLTNIIRDVGRDAERGRVYLPQEDLRRFGYTEEALFRRERTPEFIDLMRFQAERARRFFSQARDRLVSEDKPYMVAARAMGAVYEQLLEAIEQSNFDVFERRIAVPTLRKAAIVFRFWINSKFASRK
ncbi:MAG: presqualene diphosphate synthase HpnD [Bacteroidota bacterium]